MTLQVPHGDELINKNNAYGQQYSYAHKINELISARKHDLLLHGWFTACHVLHLPNGEEERIIDEG